MKPLKYLVACTIPLAIGFSLLANGWFTLVAVLYAFGCIPMLEAFLPAAIRNLDKAEEEVASEDILYDIILYIQWPLQYLLLGLFVYRITYLTPEGVEWWGITSAMGLGCGVLGINVAHELGHRKNKWEQFMAKSLLATSLYMHFFIEHNKGHHKHVSTDLDPASAKFGENLYAFWFRSIPNSLISAWQIEKNRLQAAGLKVLFYRNRVFQYLCLEVTLVCAIIFFFSLTAGLLFLSAAFIGMLLLETINYIEHYGLRRLEKTPGKFERVMPWHSWNSSHIIGRLVLFELTRHSDHHYLASRPYQVLRHMDEAPQLPGGYPAMMLLSLCPPWWFMVMNPLAEKVMQQHSNKVD